MEEARKVMMQWRRRGGDDALEEVTAPQWRLCSDHASPDSKDDRVDFHSSLNGFFLSFSHWPFHAVYF